MASARVVIVSLVSTAVFTLAALSVAGSHATVVYGVCCALAWASAALCAYNAVTRALDRAALRRGRALARQ